MGKEGKGRDRVSSVSVRWLAFNPFACQKSGLLPSEKDPNLNVGLVCHPYSKVWGYRLSNLPTDGGTHVRPPVRTPCARACMCGMIKRTDRPPSVHPTTSEPRRSLIISMHGRHEVGRTDGQRLMARSSLLFLMLLLLPSFLARPLALGRRIGRSSSHAGRR